MYGCKLSSFCWNERGSCSFCFLCFLFPSFHLFVVLLQRKPLDRRTGRPDTLCVCVSIHAQGQVKVFVTSSFSLLSCFDSATPSFSTELSLPPSDCCNCSCMEAGKGGVRLVAWRAHLIHLFCFTPADCWGPYQSIVVGSQLRVTAPCFLLFSLSFACVFVPVSAFKTT